MTYEVQLAHFNGPLDLLLHLIKEKDMDIFEIEIAVITDQYLSYLRQLEHLHLEVASEYLVMASYLLEIKSKMLLPVEKVELDDPYEEDPREQLIKRLLEYKKYKDVLDDFKLLEHTRRLHHTKISEDLSKFVQTDLALPENINAYDLIQAMQRIIDRKQKLAPQLATLVKKEWSVEDRVKAIEMRLINHRGKTINFELLIDHDERSYLIVTFLAILSLAKAQVIQIKQVHNFDEIQLIVK